MLPEEYRWIEAQFEPEGDARALAEVADLLARDGNLEGAATVYDRAYGIDPQNVEIATARRRVLDRLAVVEFGLTFRYIPGGVFLMGCEQAEVDERPWHPVWLSPYWLSETPISWATYCRLMGWDAPPAGLPHDFRARLERGDDEVDGMGAVRKMLLQYCEDHTLHARDWHSHVGPPQPGQHSFGAPSRTEADAPWQYDQKPMICVSWQRATAFAQRLTTGGMRYYLPTEAQWEKAARGGLIGCRYAWGDARPDSETCDCDRFHDFSIRPMRTFAPNGYGLYAMCGGVWEWTRDWYDGEYYRAAADSDPGGPANGQEKVLRGGSWADCPEAAAVTFRMSRPPDYYATPTIGFRLCRQAVAGAS